MDYTTLEYRVHLVRAMTVKTGLVRAEGNIVHLGRRVATAEGRIMDADGKLYAHGQIETPAPSVSEASAARCTAKFHAPSRIAAWRSIDHTALSVAAAKRSSVVRSTTRASVPILISARLATSVSEATN